jgi:hypothetical protein
LSGLQTSHSPLTQTHGFTSFARILSSTIICSKSLFNFCQSGCSLFTYWIKFSLGYWIRVPICTCLTTFLATVLYFIYIHILSPYCEKNTCSCQFFFHTHVVVTKVDSWKATKFDFLICNIISRNNVYIHFKFPLFIPMPCIIDDTDRITENDDSDVLIQTFCTRTTPVSYGGTCYVRSCCIDRRDTTQFWTSGGAS